MPSHAKSPRLPHELRRMLAARAMFLTGALAIACVSEVAFADDPPLPAAADTSSSGGPQRVESEQSAADDDPYKVFRAPLLREGSTLVEARAQIRRAGPQNWWTLALDPQPARGGVALAAATGGGTPAPHELTILPCTRLTEMERIIESAPADQAANLHFEVSGRVYVFRDHNYFLPTHAAVISAPAEPPPQPPPPPADPATTTAPVTTDAQPALAPPPAPDDDSAEAIARALQQQAGPLARSSAQGATQRLATETPPAPTAAEAPSGDAQATSERLPALQENTSVVNRRGKITRDRSGGWLLVLDADASGLADPPLKLLPCMLLEDIEDYARRTGNNSPVVVTGQVYLYNGQNHLLPTVYRIPRETSRLTP